MFLDKGCQVRTGKMCLVQPVVGCDAFLFFPMQNNHTMTQHSTIFFLSTALMHSVKLQNDKS